MRALSTSNGALAVALAFAGCTVADVTRPHTAGDASDPTAPTPPWVAPSGAYGPSVTPSPAPMAAASTPPGTTFVCPMHADVVRDAPGVCPKCGMTLVPHAPAPSGSAAPGASSHGAH